MTTEAIETQEEVHNAVPQTNPEPGTALIHFDVSTAAIAKMRAKANTLSIDGPDDKTGFNQVYELRQVVKKQRVSVEKRAKDLKAPHLLYNRNVDANAKALTGPLEQIENDLALMEKTYNDERARIAREKQLAQQQRTEGRINQLRDYGFVWNGVEETYDFIRDEFALHLRINFDDIKELSDEDYQPTLDRAGWIYESEQKEIAAKKQREQAEQQRIADEQQAEREQLARDKKALDDQAEELRRQQEAINATVLKARIARLLAVGYSENSGTYYHTGPVKIREAVILNFSDEQFDGVIKDAETYNQQREQKRIDDEAAEAERVKAQKKADDDKRKADKLRTARLHPDKKVMKAYLNHLNVPGINTKLTEEETTVIYDRFHERVADCIAHALNEIDAL